VDVYIEPFVRPRLLVVVGATPIAAALARIARSLDYRVVRVVDARERADIESDAARFGFAAATIDALDDLLKQSAAATDDRAVVVASQGHYDEEALATALTHDVPYVGLVASRTRGGAVKTLLEERGVADVGRLRNPAGLDLGAKTAPEVALSILAEMVQLRASQARTKTTAAHGAASAVPAPASSVAIDPVCHMEVEIATARHKADVDGITYYFCCAGCQSRFLKQPHEYLSRTP
jgi:xanthine dehydrogenase accessory factor